jgi:hypothetical protein
LHGYAVSAEQESDCVGALSKIAGKPRLTGEKVGSTHPFQSIGEFGHFVERERGDIDAHLANADLRSRNWFRETQYIDDQGKSRGMRGTSR